MNFKLILSVCISFFLTASYAQDIHWLNYTGTHCSIQHPEDWKVNESGHMGRIFTLSAPSMGPDDVFSENLNYVMLEVGFSDGISAKAFAATTMDQIGQVMASPKLIAAKEVIIEDKIYIRVEYTAVQNDTALHFLQYAYFKGKDMHLLTFTAPVERYQNYEARAEAIIKTFQLKEHELEKDKI